jgi:hypothetical protein
MYIVEGDVRRVRQSVSVDDGNNDDDENNDKKIGGRQQVTFPYSRIREYITKPLPPTLRSGDILLYSRILVKDTTLFSLILPFLFVGGADWWV